MLTRPLLPLALSLFFLYAPNSAHASDVTFEDGDKEWTYEKLGIHGWTVYIEKSVAGDAELKAKIQKQLKGGIGRFHKEVPEARIEFLKSIPIWVSTEPNYPLRKGERGVIPFHRSKGWLRGRGLNPHMAPGVHVINPQAILFEHKVFEWAPMTLLHELAHAYHNVKLGLKNKAIKDAYANAMAKSLYLRVPDRKNNTKKVRAYAATNIEEYFAELTEAYFGKNDWFPHNRRS